MHLSLSWAPFPSSFLISSTMCCWSEFHYTAKTRESSPATAENGIRTTPFLSQSGTHHHLQRALHKIEPALRSHSLPSSGHWFSQTKDNEPGPEAA